MAFRESKWFVAIWVRAALQDDATSILEIVKGYGEAIELLEPWMAVNCSISFVLNSCAERQQIILCNARE